MLTPLTRCRASATFLSGNLPTSSEVMTSTTVWESRFTSSDSFKLARMPVTSTVSTLFARRFAPAGVGCGVLLPAPVKRLRQPSSTYSSSNNRLPVLGIRADQYGSNIVPIEPNRLAFSETTEQVEAFIKKKHRLILILLWRKVLSGIALVIFRWHGLHTSGGNRLANSFAGIAAAR